jgi:hypothetical protein
MGLTIIPLNWDGSFVLSPPLPGEETSAQSSGGLCAVDLRNWAARTHAPPSLHLLGFVHLDRLAQTVISRSSLSLPLGLFHGAFTAGPAIIDLLRRSAPPRCVGAADELLQFAIQALFVVDELPDAL